MNILKRLFVHIGGFNLGLLMRTLIGVGTPRGLQGRLAGVVATIVALMAQIWGAAAIGVPDVDHFRPHHHSESLPTRMSTEAF